MKKKILLTITALILLSVVTLVLLNYLKIFTIQDLKELSLTKAKSVPVVNEYLVSKGDNERLKGKIEALESELMKVQQQNKDLLEELKLKDREITEQENEISILKTKNEQIKIDKKNYKEKIKRLADVYSEMAPERAASILPKLNTRLVIDIFRIMDEEIVAEILGLIPADLAADISIRLSH